MIENLKAIIAAFFFGLFTVIFLWPLMALLHEAMGGGRIMGVFLSGLSLLAGGMVSGAIIGKLWLTRSAWQYCAAILSSPGPFLAFWSWRTTSIDPDQTIDAGRLLIQMIAPMLCALLTVYGWTVWIRKR